MSLIRSSAYCAATVLVTVGTASSAIAANRSIDGSGNNVLNPSWGASDTNLLRFSPIAYGDGVSTMARQGVSGPREISNAVHAQVGSTLNNRGMTDMVWQWGQFVDHDIDLTPGADPAEPMPISTPGGDPFFAGTPIGFNRSIHDGGGPRQQKNIISSFIDASNIYGSDAVRANTLRINDGSGKLLTSAGNLLPFNTFGLDNANESPIPNNQMFVSGDVRANEQVGLTSMHTLFMREHNRLADTIKSNNPGMSGEDVYQAARKIVGAEMQVITYKGFLPALLGDGAVAATGTYDANIDAGIGNEFSTAAYRLGHTMLSSTLLRRGGNGQMIPDGDLALKDGFFNPTRITNEGGIDPLLKGLSSQAAQEIDVKVVDDVRNFLFGPPGAGGFDLASLNIQRGRDHGLADYNTMRQSFGLAAVANFSDITSDASVQAALASVYNDVDEIDPWVGMLAEDHVAGGSVGETLAAIVSDQFNRLRDGDRFWYENDGDLAAALTAASLTLADLEDIRLKDIMVFNSDLDATQLQSNVFFIPAPGAGSLFAFAGLAIARRRRR